MKTISGRLFLTLILLLSVITGGAGILYSVTTRNMYLNEQCKAVEQAYEEIRRQNIELLCKSGNQRKERAEEDELKEQSGDGLVPYENDNMRFRIRGERFELLYATSKLAQTNGSMDPQQREQWMQKYQEEQLIKEHYLPL